MKIQKTSKKITKLADLNTIHAKVEKEEPTTLEQILGKDYSMRKYKTDNIKEYLSELETLNIAELRTHALTLGSFIPNQDRNKLIKQLEREFNKYHAVYNKPKQKIKENTEGQKKKLEDALKVMSAVKS